MKSWMSAVLALMSLQTAPAVAQGFGLDDLITLGTTVLGGAVGYKACEDERGAVQFFCTGAGAGLGYILGRAVTDNDERARVGYFNDCMNAYQCRRGRLADSGYYVEYRQGQRAYMPTRPGVQCRSYVEVVTDRRGRPRHQQTKYACFNSRSRRWAPIPPDYYGQMRFYDGNNDPRMRRWDYDAPAVLPQQGGNHQQPPLPGGQWRTRPVNPPPVAGPATPQQPSAPVVVAPQPQQPRPLPPPLLPYPTGAPGVR